ncbi:MAG: hypothetical protein WBA67_16520 [Jannaschia sp.]
MLNHSQAVRHAQALYNMQGRRAEAIAADRARKENENGDRQAAIAWERIRDALRDRRPAHES